MRKVPGVLIAAGRVCIAVVVVLRSGVPGLVSICCPVILMAERVVVAG